MIFAKLDVTLAYHAKAHKAGAAMATWAWALAYTREQELDGFIPVDSLRLAWVGEAQARKDCDRLVLVGLFAQTEGGWMMCKYGEKNETKATIAERRGEARERMYRVRANRPRTSGEQSANVRSDTTGAVPGSVSGSVSDLGSQIASGEILERTAPLAADARQVFDAIAMNRHVGQTPEIAWTNFAGHFAGQHFPSREATLGRWQKWVNQQCVYGERDREKERKQQDAADERRRFAREGPPKPPPITPDQQKRFAAELEARLMAKKAAGT